MSEMPLEDLPCLASAARRAAEGGQVVYLAEHGQRLAAILPADAYGRSSASASRTLQASSSAWSRL